LVGTALAEIPVEPQIVIKFVRGTNYKFLKTYYRLVNKNSK